MYFLNLELYIEKSENKKLLIGKKPFLLLLLIQLLKKIFYNSSINSFLNKVFKIFPDVSGLYLLISVRHVPTDGF